MFLIKNLDDVLKVGGARLKGSVPRVTQLEADEQRVSTTWQDVAEDGGREEGGYLMMDSLDRFSAGTEPRVELA